MRERAKAEGRQDPVAKAINTSSTVAELQGRKMVLFFTGHAHAGQNLAKVLAHRAKELEPPMQMCDALAANVSAEFATVLSTACDTADGCSSTSWNTFPKRAAT